MTTRRKYLTLLGTGTTALAGCTTNTENQENTDNTEINQTEPNKPNQEPTNNTEASGNDTKETDDTEEEKEPEFEIPLDGLGAYEEKVREARPRQKIFDQIDRILEQSDNPDQLADLLSSNKITTGAVEHNLYELASALYQKQKEKTSENIDDTVVFNKNWSFTSDSEAIIETYTVKNGKLQSQPIIADPENGQVYMRHKPGDGRDPTYLQQIRTDDNWASMVPQDYDAVLDRIEYGKERGGTEEEVRRFRTSVLENWSSGLFGMNSDPKIIPHDPKSSNIVFDGLYHDGDTNAVVELNQQYEDSDLPDSDEIISAEHTKDGWNFHELPDFEMGDELPAHNP